MKKQVIKRFSFIDAVEVLTKPHQLIHYVKGSYRLYDAETKEDYGYITYKDFQKLSVTEVTFKGQYRNEAFYRF